MNLETTISHSIGSAIPPVGPPDNPDSLERLAAEGVELHPSDRDKATDHFVRRLQELPHLQREANRRLGRSLVGEVLRALHFAKMRHDLPRVAAEVRQNLGGVMQSWRFRISGKSLHEATRADLRLEIANLRSVIVGLQARVTFFETLLKRLRTDEETVGDRFTEEEVVKLAEKLEGKKP